MTEPIEDTQAWNPEERDVEEEDESGAPEKVAWPKTDDGLPLEAVDELREPPYETSPTPARQVASRPMTVR